MHRTNRQDHRISQVESEQLPLRKQKFSSLELALTNLANNQDLLFLLLIASSGLARELALYQDRDPRDLLQEYLLRAFLTVFLLPESECSKKIEPFLLSLSDYVFK